MTIPSTMAVGLHAFDAEIVDLQNAVLGLLGAFVSSILSIANGGTNSGAALSGSSIIVSNGTQIVQGPAGTTTTILHGNAAGAPTYAGVSLANDTTANQGTATTVLHGNAAGQPSFSAVSLTADVTGVTPIANGGTNSTATATNGGVGYGTGTAHAYSAAGTSGQLLLSAGAAAPAWYGTPYLIAASSAGQSINSATETTIVYGTVETDSDSAYNSTTGVFTVPTNKGGVYLVAAACTFTLALVAVDVDTSIWVNGTQKRTVQTANTVANQTLVISSLVSATAGQTIEVKVYQDTGLSKSLNTATNENYLTIRQVA